MKTAFICKIGSSPLKFILSENSKISDLLNSAGIDLGSGEVVKAQSTEETINPSEFITDEETYVIVREMKNA